MAIIRCKMCGGDIALSADKTHGTCDCCGSAMTFPKITDEQRAAAFNRGNHFRRIGEFDKALQVYEHIVREDDTDAEAHWCCALCRFGIEYVEDPNTLEWLPTCHRASFDSFLEDVDYKAALENSDGVTRRQYQKDGTKIAEVQRGILATSQKSEAYDVFICYKESDESGNRTKDSMLAQEIYYQLTEQGRKVFFARITLEDVMGKQYEPYIFAALNSAKVMIVVGTKPEHLNAVWVKNEWSRFLTMMKKDRNKLLLPCYRDMDPYDLPEQLSVLQSYDMAKIGFIQDLIRGISKVLDVQKKAEPEMAVPNVESRLRRAALYLESSDWQKADEYCEQVLDIDPENPQAYLGKLMAELKVCCKEDLAACEKPFGNMPNYQMVKRFGTPAMVQELDGYLGVIRERMLEKAYVEAEGMMNSAKLENQLIAAAYQFERISQYRDAADMAKKCREKAEKLRKEAENARKNEIYFAAKKRIDKEEVDFQDLKFALAEFQKIPDWKDADKMIRVCQEKIKEVEEREMEEEMQEMQSRRKTVLMTIIVTVVIVVIVALAVLITAILPQIRYQNAKDLIAKGKYAEAIVLLEKSGDYEDAENQLRQCRYYYANQLVIQEKYSEASKQYDEAGYPAGSDEVIFCDYMIACQKMEVGSYRSALTILEGIPSYKDAAERMRICHYHIGIALIGQELYQNAIPELEAAEGYADSEEHLQSCYRLAK